MRQRRHLSLQAKISLVLAAVILPTFLIVTIAENKLTFPIMKEEMRQVGIYTGKTLASQIVSGRLLSQSNSSSAVEDALQNLIFNQPSIVRVDVFTKDAQTGGTRLVASNVVDDSPVLLQPYPIADAVTSEYSSDEEGSKVWDISVPIEGRSRDARGNKKIVGSVRVVVSTQLLGRMASTLWKTTASAAALSVVTLILALSYFLRKTIENDRRLKNAESQNIRLVERLHAAERQLMNSEKLAVMGQLTASFAHEIGTPLNAIGGHLQLLKDELLPVCGERGAARLEIVNSQVGKIESIVKGFLHNTEKPPSQKQLSDVNLLLDRTLSIVTPRISQLKVDVKRKFDREMGPIRIVPLDLEQIFLNLINNSLDSFESKLKAVEKTKVLLEVRSGILHENGREWAEISIYDTGEGISKPDMRNVFKPFYTTKQPGQGTGLGLTICQQLAQKNGGFLSVDSKEGAWTRVTLRLPFHKVEGEYAV